MQMHYQLNRMKEIMFVKQICIQHNLIPQNNLVQLKCLEVGALVKFGLFHLGKKLLAFTTYFQTL